MRKSSRTSAARLRLRSVCARAAAVKRVAKTRSKRTKGSSVAGSASVCGVSWQPNRSVTRLTARVAR